jgi:hypothetical protein
MDLIIVGNGFDMNEGLNTSYKQLREYLKKNCEELYEDLISFYQSIFEDNFLNEDIIDFSKSTIINENTKKTIYPNDVFLWSHFEKNIANPSYSDIRDEYGFGKFQNPNYDETVERLIKLYNDSLQSLQVEIKEWIKSINTESLFKKKIINPSRFINFNYSETLENRYSVRKDNICYIHNSIKDEHIVFGCDKESINSFYNYTQFSHDEYDGHTNFVIKLKFILNKYVKPTKKILNEKLIPFCVDKIFDRVFVLGSSISDVDKIYFDYLIDKFFAAKWFISYHMSDINDFSDLNNKRDYFRNKNLKVTYGDIKSFLDFLSIDL